MGNFNSTVSFKYLSSTHINAIFSQVKNNIFYEFETYHPKVNLKKLIKRLKDLQFFSQFAVE